MCGVLAAGVAAAAEPPPAGLGVPAVWKRQTLEFHYFGRTSRYSCDGLRDKMRALLLEMGVRNDLRIRTSGCEIGRISLAGLNPGLSIEFSAPVPRDAADTGAADKPFEARYTAFDFHQDAFRNLNIGDCELVEEFARQVLPRLSARDLKQDITCVPYQSGAGTYRVSGVVLKAVPAADAARR